MDQYLPFSLPPADQLQPRHGMYLTSASVVFFALLNLLLKAIGPPKGLQEEAWRWRNVYVSWVHAVVASHWAVLSLVMYPELLQDLFGHVTLLTYACVCFSTGYFTYDLLDTVVHRNTLNNWEVVVHHIANGTAFYYNIVYKAHIGYNIVAFLLEINTVFLHWRKLLQWVHTPYNSRHYLVVKHLNLLSYLPCRVFSTCVITTVFFRHFHEEPVFILVVLAIACPLMHTLNSVLLYRLVKSDLYRGPGGAKVDAWTTIKRDAGVIFGGAPVAAVVSKRGGRKVEGGGPAVRNGGAYRRNTHTASQYGESEGD